MPNAVVTVLITGRDGPRWEGGWYNDLAALTHPSLEAYAKRIGAEFVVHDRMALSKSVTHYEKLILGELLKKYDRIVFMDTDMLVRNDCPDLFKEVPADLFGAVAEDTVIDRRQAWRSAKHSFGIDCEIPPGRLYVNSGLMVVSKEHAGVFVMPQQEKFEFADQSWINLRLCLLATPMRYLPYQFNHCIRWNHKCSSCEHPLSTHRKDSYVIHYAGGRRDHVQCLHMIQRDLEYWREHGQLD